MISYAHQGLALSNAFLYRDLGILKLDKVDRVEFVVNQKGSADFVDYVVGRINKFNECTYTVTFDEQASLSDAFELLNFSIEASEK